MKKSIVLLAAMSVAGVAMAAAYDGVYVLGLKGTYPAPQGGTYDLVGAGCLAYDTTSTTNGVCNRIYILDTTQWEGHGRIHSFDPVAGTFSGPLTASDFFKGRDLCVDSSGDVYVAQPWGKAGTTNGCVYKVTGLNGPPPPEIINMFMQRDVDADTSALDLVPAGWGGPYEAGRDLVIGDGNWLNSTTTNGVAVLDAASLSTNYTLTTMIINSDGGQIPYLASSDTEGVVYVFRKGGLDHADFGGADRPFVSRLYGNGTVERVFLDIDPAVLGTLDDGLEINQMDGSLWMITTQSDNSRDLYRIDVLNAVATNGDFVASLDLVIDNFGYDPGINGIAISPNGTQLAVVCPTGPDTLYLYDITSDTYSYEDWAEEFLLTGGDADPMADFDGDNLNNLTEYAFGGDPTNALDQGLPTTTTLIGEGGTNWLEYVYPKQSYAYSDLSYYIELTDNLAYGTWTNAGYSVLGTGMINDDFNAVTNRIPTGSKDKQFIRLIVEEK